MIPYTGLPTPFAHATRTPPQNTRAPQPTPTGAPMPSNVTELTRLTADLQEIHQQGLRSPDTTPSFGATYQWEELDQHFHQLSLLKSLSQTEIDISECEKTLRSLEKEDASPLANANYSRLIALKEKHLAIRHELNMTPAKAGTAPASPRLNSAIGTTTTTTTTPFPATTALQRSPGMSPSREATSIASPTASRSPTGSAANPRRTRDESEAKHETSSGSDHEANYESEYESDHDSVSYSSGDKNLLSNSADSEDGRSSSPDELAALLDKRASLERRRQKLQARASTPDGLSGSDDDSRSDPDDARAEITKLTRQIDALSAPIKRLSANAGADLGDDQPSEKHSKLSSLVRTITTQRLDHSRATQAGSRRTPSTQQANLRQLHETADETVLTMPEDRPHVADGRHADKLDALKAAMESLAEQGDNAFSQYKRLQKAIARDRENDDVGPATSAAKEKKLQKLENEWLRCVVRLDKLADRYDALAGQMSLTADARKALVESSKSDETRELEKAHAEKLAELQKRVKEDMGYTLGYDALAGIAGFSSSFLIGNTLARFLPGWWGVIVPPFISGSFHVAVATPIVKNIMARTWSANSLAELNNYFKLLGARWGDHARGETDVPKYASGKVGVPEKLTIEEKWAQQKSLWTLTGRRYLDEELAYWTYSYNYAIKAALCACFSEQLSQGTMPVRAFEAGLHGLMGMISGAEYVTTQQALRSDRPGAKAAAVPTREIFSAQAAALKSLRNDLADALDAYQQAPGNDARDPAARALRKEIARIDLEMKGAETKAGWGGIARYELAAQWQPGALSDTLSEIFGRIITLAPTTATSYLTASMRKSPDPLMMFLGHFLPALALMFPFTGGFTSRPWVCGIIRAAIQAFINGKAGQTVASQVPPDIREEAALGQRKAADSSVEVSELKPWEESSSEVSEGEISGAHQGAAETPPDDSSIVEASEVWTGNPTQRDENAAN